MKKYTRHENDVVAKKLAGREHKMVVQPETMNSRNMCAGVAFFPINEKAPPHVHEKEEEILYVLGGEGKMYFNGVGEELIPGTFMYVPRGVEHRIAPASPEGLKVFYVFSPPVRQGSYEKKNNANQEEL